ncbi:MAG: helix-hairpin-helix domain-containing protein [Verrucomicrobiota bacterium]
MKQELFETISARMTGYSLAILGANHGYRFQGDTVALQAMFAVLDQAAHNRNWALQLWACPHAPASAADLTGHLVAQAALPPIGEIADEIESFEVHAVASQLAGQADYSMVLVLVAGNNGRYDEVHSLSVYPQRQQFQQPQIRGNAGYCIEGDRVRLTVDSIFNPRCADNVSGTLSLELWALTEPYVGGAFEGAALTGATFGQLAGQAEASLREFNLTFTPPPAGVWHYALMLREWTAAGFVTRDFVSFAQPVVIAPVTPAVVEMPAAAPVVPELEIAAEVALAVPTVKKPAKTVKASAAAPAKAKKTVKETTPKEIKVSVNSASVELLAAVKGMPEKVAKGIVKARPFANLDELVKVSGMGAKLLAKLRNYLRL